MVKKHCSLSRFNLCCSASMELNCVSDCAPLKDERVKLIDPKGKFCCCQFCLVRNRSRFQELLSSQLKTTREKERFFFSFFKKATISSNCCFKLLSCFKVQFIKNIYLINHCRTLPNTRVTFSDINNALLILTQN